MNIPKIDVVINDVKKIECETDKHNEKVKTSALEKIRSEICDGLKKGQRLVKSSSSDLCENDLSETQNEFIEAGYEANIGYHYCNNIGIKSFAYIHVYISQAKLNSTSQL